MKTNNTKDIIDKIKIYASFALTEVILGVAFVAIGWNVNSENVKYTLMVLGALFLIAGAYTLFVKINKMLCIVYGRNATEVSEENDNVVF